MAVAAPINFLQWIEDHRDLLKPPVGNQCIYDGGDFIVMVVGGPNSRKDYHYDEGEELFYQIEGDITVKIIDDGQPRDIPIRQGEMFLLPARVPHSPQRGPNTVGLVVERKRRPDELDGFMWFCEQCGNKLYEEFLHVSDIVKQLPPIFERFYSSVEHRTCSACGAVMEPPSPPKA
ncbi:MAG: 3-hydroxyanthranilate 3,4-dioxygenase [Candidatus Kapaibacterium sp.]|nr:MAG: 3-hydroxyanthranilate 3,4-dioxygenase [Candidatus Kapabacteria bacterium]